MLLTNALLKKEKTKSKIVSVALVTNSEYISTCYLTFVCVLIGAQQLNSKIVSVINMQWCLSMLLMVFSKTTT